MRFAFLLLTTPAFAKINFVRQVKPILETHCVRCHGGDHPMKNLRLDRKDRAMRAVVVRHPEESTLYLAAKIGAMPPGPDKLSPTDLETLRKWIAEGARWPRNVELQWTR